MGACKFFNMSASRFCGWPEYETPLSGYCIRPASKHESVGRRARSRKPPTIDKNFRRWAVSRLTKPTHITSYKPANFLYTYNNMAVC